MSSIATEIKERIFEAADRLHAAPGREGFPTVDAVRREAKVDMNSASAAMKEWRKAQTAAPAAVAVAVPESIGKAASELVASVWKQAQELANDSLKSAEAAWAVDRTEADALRAELAEAHDAQTLQIDGLLQQLTAAEALASITAAQHLEQVNGLEQQLLGAEQLLHDTRETLAKKEGKLEGVTAQLSAAQVALSKAETAMGTAEQRTALLEQQLQALRDKNADLQGQLDQATSRATVAEATLEAQRQVVAKAEQATQAAHAKSQEIDGQLRALQVSSAKAEGKNEALEQQLEGLLKALEQPKAEGQPKT